MKRILVPIDFSPTSEKAFLFALGIASRSQGSIILYHVYTPAESSFIDVETKRKLYNEQTERELIKRLERLKKKVTSSGMNIPVSAVLGRTPIINNILGFAEDNKIDLIVMGTQGGSGLKKAIIGSVAVHVIENSDLPVLLIPEKYELKVPEKFVFATDFEQTDKRALKLVLAVAKLYAADVSIIHVLDINLPERDKEKEQNDFEAYAYGLQREFNDHKLKFQLLKTSSVVETMENLHSQVSYDVIAMVRRKKRFFEKFILKSFTKKMAHVTTQPLLVVPQEQ